MEGTRVSYALATELEDYLNLRIDRTADSIENGELEFVYKVRRYRQRPVSDLGDVVRLR